MDHIPTIVFLKEGKLVEHFTGAKYLHGATGERGAADESYLKRKIDKFLDEYPITLQTIGDSSLNLETKLNLHENSLITLKERYLKKDDKGKVIEIPEEMFRRVASNIAKADSFYKSSKDQVKETEDSFYEMMTNMEFLPNSPTLMNAGRDLQQLSGCFVLPIGDSMEDIFGAAMKGALVHKSGGGTGYSFSKLRPKNSRVKSTSGIASGPVSFIYVFNVYTETVKQGGTRRGANMGILRVNHPDIRDFIHAKGELNEINREVITNLKKDLNLEDDDPYILTLKRKLLERTQLNNFNLSVGLTEEFMKAAKEDDYFELKDPHTGKVSERIKAKGLLEEIVDQSWKTGDPGIIFLDRINRGNPTPHTGEIESTNPCGEQPLLANESCNLGSINLSKFVKNKKIDYPRLRQTVHKAVHFLDNVIDMNSYPLPEIEQLTKANRKVGLGVMGFADMAVMLRIPYGSEASFKLAEDIMKFVRDEARQASIKLAENRGLFPNWKGSIYDPESQYFKGEELKLRNATLTTIAPTGTLSMIANCEPGVEPIFSIAYTKTVMDGKILHYRARGLEQVLKEDGYDSDGIFLELEQGRWDKLNQLPEEIKKLAVTSMQLTPEQHLKMQAAFQKFTDNAVSKTINFPTIATKEDIKKAYLLAYELECKGLTVYRDKSKDIQVLEEKVAEKFDFKSKLPKEVLSITREEIVGDKKRVFVTIGYWENERNKKEIARLKKEGRPTQFFIDANFFDPKTQALITALAIRGSKDLREGIPPEEIIEDLKNLPPSDEIGYDKGFGPSKEYINRSIPDAIQKALSGWEPPKYKIDEKETEKKQHLIETKNTDDKNSLGNGFGFCNNCSKFGVDHREGCDKCIYCGKSKKGCS
ncbi:adenosylcobalamin-dependent ribonucleoside-diphosphate reductase [Candidatus Woesearchaeota archaeon]|nr:adenosylcobalamin-dependent ribonucleoside-diphosphate reductase [Candidatus Woesearchaeota archaeon]